jgi:hypothetical protein
VRTSESVTVGTGVDLQRGDTGAHSRSSYVELGPAEDGAGGAARRPGLFAPGGAGALTEYTEYRKFSPLRTAYMERTLAAVLRLATSVPLSESQPGSSLRTTRDRETGASDLSESGGSQEATHPLEWIRGLPSARTAGSSFH